MENIFFLEVALSYPKDIMWHFLEQAKWDDEKEILENSIILVLLKSGRRKGRKKLSTSHGIIPVCFLNYVALCKLKICIQKS